jgi:hypothetical protein
LIDAAVAKGMDERVIAAIKATNFFIAKL